MEALHRPVLVQEVLDLVALPSPRLLVDCTTGEGGHTIRFLERYPELKVIALDADASMQERAKKRLAGHADRVRFVHAWFDEFLSQGLTDERPDLLLFDLGVSMVHFKGAGRGFSLLEDVEMDMRLDPTAGETAADLLGRLDEPALVELLREYGEEPFAGRIARAVCAAAARPRRAREFAELVWRAVPVSVRHRRVHPATRCFQALRIAVNGELDRLARALAAGWQVLAPGGRMGVITFHSLEDRVVKRFFKGLAMPEPGENAKTMKRQRMAAADAVLITRKALGPGAMELRENPASRSAKLRVLEKKPGGLE